MNHYSRYRPGLPAGLLTLFALILCNDMDSRAAEVVEWFVDSPRLSDRITTSLLRYYSVIQGDSNLVDYIRTNQTRQRYRLRAQVTENDSDGRLLVVSLGQLQLFTTEKIRVALGDQLYDDLLATRLAEGTEIERIFLGDPFTERDWTEDYRVALSLFERIDIRILNELNLFASLGAPESNLDFWTDGSFRVGGAAPGWEAAILFPWSGGSIGIGPVGSRLLTPGYGASLMVETSFGRGRVRFTDAASARTEATRSLDRQFIHTLSGELTGRYRVQSGSFDLTITGGFDVEQFDELVRPGDTLRLDGYIRRLSPVADIAIVLADNNIRATLGYYDLAFRASLTARLSRDLWLESRLVAPGMTRELAPFEHPATFFITPRIRF